MKHISHYFERVENYLRNANGIKNYEVLIQLIKADECPEEQILQVLNGAMVEYLFDVMPNKDGFVRIYAPDGKAAYEKKHEYTYDEWIKILQMTFVGLPIGYAEKIISYMFTKGYIIRADNNIFYRELAPMRRIPVEL